VFLYKWDLEITGGNAEVAENRGIAERAIRKLMQGKKLKIDGGMKMRFADLKDGIRGRNCGWCGSETT
jgi:hypothetical protein